MTIATAVVPEAPLPAARTEQSDRRTFQRRVALLLCVAAVLGFYLRCSWSYGKDLNPALVRIDFQNRQADAFICPGSPSSHRRGLFSSA